MYALLRTLRALTASRCVSPVSDAARSSTNESERSVPESVPLCTPIDLFHQRYPREFWAANTPQLKDNHLVTGPKELEAEADEDLIDYVLTPNFRKGNPPRLPHLPHR